MSYQWVTLEKKLPNSINTGTEWIKLSPGECTDIDMADSETNGILRYSDKPSQSNSFITKKFVSPEMGNIRESELKLFYSYSRWWRVNYETPYRLEYTAFSEGAIPTSFTVEGYQDFNQDGDGPIIIVVPSGSGELFILKANAGYVLSNCAGSGTSFQKSRAYYNIGSCLTGSHYSNAMIDGKVAVAWDCGGLTGVRHFLWNGGDTSIELSRNVRKYSEAQSKDTVVAINWAQNLVIADDIVYDLESRKIFRYSGAKTASFITRAYTDQLFRNMLVKKLAFYTTGKTGSFTPIIEYGQAEDNLANQRSQKIVVSKSIQNRFRHVWSLETPAKARAFRLTIESLSGTIGIFQIDALVDIISDPDAPGDG
jgi:hypothetical protein